LTIENRRRYFTNCDFRLAIEDPRRESCRGVKKSPTIRQLTIINRRFPLQFPLLGQGRLVPLWFLPEWPQLDTRSNYHAAESCWFPVCWLASLSFASVLVCGIST
jgi:hypothetical protein